MDPKSFIYSMLQKRPQNCILCRSRMSRYLSVQTRVVCLHSEHFFSCQRLWELCLHRWDLEASPSSLPLPSKSRSFWTSNYKLPQRLHGGARNAIIGLLRGAQWACKGEKHPNQFKGIHPRLLPSAEKSRWYLCIHYFITCFITDVLFTLVLSCRLVGIACNHVSVASTELQLV